MTSKALATRTNKTISGSAVLAVLAVIVTIIIRKVR